MFCAFLSSVLNFILIPETFRENLVNLHNILKHVSPSIPSWFSALETFAQSKQQTQIQQAYRISVLWFCAELIVDHLFNQLLVQVLGLPT